MIENKIKGREITIPPTLARGHVIDLMTALKESFKTIERGKERADQKKRRKAWRAWLYQYELKSYSYRWVFFLRSSINSKSTDILFHGFSTWVCSWYLSHRTTWSHFSRPQVAKFGTVALPHTHFVSLMLSSSRSNAMSTHEDKPADRRWHPWSSGKPAQRNASCIEAITLGQWPAYNPNSGFCFIAADNRVAPEKLQVKGTLNTQFRGWCCRDGLLEAMKALVIKKNF
jgi:hypothetical protein